MTVRGIAHDIPQKCLGCPAPVGPPCPTFFPASLTRRWRRRGKELITVPQQSMAEHHFANIIQIMHQKASNINEHIEVHLRQYVNVEYSMKQQNENIKLQDFMRLSLQALFYKKLGSSPITKTNQDLLFLYFWPLFSSKSVFKVS